MSKYDLVLYDLDGTLQDSVPLIMESFRAAYGTVLGECTRTDEDLMSYIGKPLTDTFWMHDEETAESLVKAYLEYNCAQMRKNVVPVFPGVYEFLSEIQAMGIRQGLVTSKLKSSAMITIELLELEKYFDTMVFREDTELAKPHGDPIIEAARRMGVTDMGRVLYVGDAVPDGLSAREAGCGFALVGWTKMPREGLESTEPDHIIDVPAALPCIIRGTEL